MSHKGSQEMRKQYGRQEVAFNLLEPERRARPGLDYTCTKHSNAVTAIDKEIGHKASSQDPRTKPTPLNTMQPGVGACILNFSTTPAYYCIRNEWFFIARMRFPPKGMLQFLFFRLSVHLSVVAVVSCCFCGSSTRRSTQSWCDSRHDSHGLWVRRIHMIRDPEKYPV